MAAHPTRKEPPWPEWTAETFSPEGLRLLAMGHDWIRGNANLDRHNRISTEDFAIAAIACWLVAGRTDLLKKIP